MADEKAEQKNDDFAAATISMLGKFYAEGKYWDVQLQIDTELFRCQRSLLAATSEYFDVMFNGNFKESSNSTMSDEPIILHGLDLAAFKEILNFIYTGQIVINDTNVHQLLSMTDYLRLRTTHIKKKCIEYVVNRSQTRAKIMSNAFDLFSFACMKAEPTLVSALCTHISDHLYHYSKDEKLADAAFESLNTLLKFSKDCILPFRGSHNVMLKIIHTWINHDRKERGKYRSELMQNINFSNISPGYALSVINGLENVADAVSLLPEDTKLALEELETLKMGVEIDQIDDDARLRATISLRIENVTRKWFREKSSCSIISSLPWIIIVSKLRSEEMLSVCLYCEATSNKTSMWKCYADAELEIVSDNKENYVENLCHNTLFSPNMTVDGTSTTIKIMMEDLIDPENGYIRNNSITVNVHVQVDVPIGRLNLNEAECLGILETVDE